MKPKSIKKYININNDWNFFKGEDLTFREISKLEKNHWQKINLPHDWSIYEDFNQKSLARNEGGLLDGGFGYYKKYIEIDESLADKKIYIRFGAIYMDSSVWVNGKFIANYPFGYNEITYDITDYLYYGNNTIIVKVEHRQPSSRWYSGSGIYRNVSLIIKNRLNFEENSIVIRHKNLEKNFDNNICSHVSYLVDNQTREDKNFNVRYEIISDDNKTLLKKHTQIELVKAGETLKSSLEFSIYRPTLWSIDNPFNYYLKISLITGEKIVDVQVVRFAYRYIEWDPKEGFYLNGKYMKLHGVCLHHDNGALGASLDVDADRRKLEIMKSMGVNSIRTSHNPQSREFIELCDEMGFLVIEEAFDTWYKNPKKEYDYNRFFNKKASHPDAEQGQTWACFDIQEMVKRDINSPSVFMWSIGNEIWESKQAHGVKQAQDLIKWVKKIDDSRFITIGEERLVMESKEGYHVEIADKLDAVGLNYCENNLENIINDHPDWRIYGSETSSSLKSRGVYYNPSEKDSIATGNPNKPQRKYQMSDYGNDRVGWGKTAISSWIYDRDCKNYAGQYIWTGFDYIGEPTPWHNEENLGAPVKSSYFGIVDTCGFPKNDYYFYQSQWIKKEEKPMVKILPHWNWDDRKKLKKLGTDLKRDDNLIPVRVYSNLESVELFLNGKSLGKKSFKKKQTSYGLQYLEGEQKDELYLEWLINYEKGNLEAKASEGIYTVYDSIRTSEEEYSINLKPMSQVIKDKTLFIEFSIIDRNKVINPLADNEVEFLIEGADFLGVDNGNPSSQERYKRYDDKSIKRRAFSGKGVIIVRPKENTIRIVAKSRNLKSFELVENANDNKLFSKPSQNQIDIEINPIRKTKHIEVVTKNFYGEIESKLNLPERVKVLYKNNRFGFEKVIWDRPYKFDVSGLYKIIGFVNNEKIEFNAHINDFIKCKDFNLTLKHNSIIPFPYRTYIYSTSGEKKEVFIEKWDKLDELNYEASIVNSNLKCKLTINYSNNLVDSYNYALQWNGSELPAAIASYTNKDKESLDNIQSLNNGITSYNKSFVDRWSNKSRSFRKEDWAGIIFARAGRLEKHSIYKLKVAFCEEDDIAIPEIESVEYFIKDDLKLPKDYGNIEEIEHEFNEKASWLKVENLQINKDGLFATCLFDEIETLAIRLKMKAKEKKFIAISELEAYGRVAIEDVGGENG